jgi:hypothetical protein
MLNLLIFSAELLGIIVCWILTILVVFAFVGAIVKIDD